MTKRLQSFLYLNGKVTGKRRVFVTMFEEEEAGFDVYVEEDRFRDEKRIYARLVARAVQHCLKKRGIPFQYEKDASSPFLRSRLEVEGGKKPLTLGG